MQQMPIKSLTRFSVPLRLKPQNLFNRHHARGNGYAALVRDHISTEDDILSPLAAEPSYHSDI